MNRRDFMYSGSAVGAISSSLPISSPAAATKRVLMKAGATVQDGRGQGGRGGADPDPDYGFRSLGRWGIRNVVATARIADGRRDDFMEVGIEEGDVDMFRAMQAHKEVEYSGMIMPDHAVASPSETGGEYMAFCYGYIRALIQAVDNVA